jgi:hypothetical protein
MPDLKYEIKRNVGVLGRGAKGWTKELNIISWNDRRAKIDIRDWDEKHEKMSRGITLSKEEVIELKKLLQQVDEGELG